MKYCSNVMFVLLWFIAFVNCEKVCDVQKGEMKCCIHYQLVNGACVECPKDWIGNDCTVSCPNGYYGVFCTGTCNCTDDQICDAQDGCVQNKTVDTLTTMETTSTEQQTTKSNGYHEGILSIMETTSTEQQTTISNGYYEGILWNHLHGITLGIVVIVLVVLLVHTHRMWKTIYQEIESRHDQQTEEARSQAVELNKNKEESVYDQICEYDT